MSYKVYLQGSLSPIEWSQLAWRLEGRAVPVHTCTEELLHDVLLRHIPKNGVIVDAGCGTGKWLIYLQRLGYRMVGIEMSREAGIIAKENQSDARVVQADVRGLPLRSQSIDAVLSLGVVEHDESGPLAALGEAHRILKPNGVLVLVVPYNNLLRRLLMNRLLAYVNWRRRALVQLCFTEYRFSASEIRRFLKCAGFEVVAVYPDDMLPPKNMGIWVDYHNLIFDPFSPEKTELYALPRGAAKLAGWALRWLPWLVCGEITFVARAA
jgi:SAM-dependent methyltransferase